MGSGRVVEEQCEGDAVTVQMRFYIERPDIGVLPLLRF